MIVAFSQSSFGGGGQVQAYVDDSWAGSTQGELVATDPQGLNQVLAANLISNAFRYTEQGEIRIERDGEELLVIDSGSGIDEELQPDVTKPAVKGHASPGLGLGLSIVERLCERCGWRFQLASSAEGTTARLVLG